MSHFAQWLLSLMINAIFLHITCITWDNTLWAYTHHCAWFPVMSSRPGPNPQHPIFVTCTHSHRSMSFGRTSLYFTRDGNNTLRCLTIDRKVRGKWWRLEAVNHESRESRGKIREPEITVFSTSSRRGKKRNHLVPRTFMLCQNKRSSCLARKI